MIQTHHTHTHSHTHTHTHTHTHARTHTHTCTCTRPTHTHIPTSSTQQCMSTRRKRSHHSVSNSDTNTLQALAPSCSDDVSAFKENRSDSAKRRERIPGSFFQNTCDIRTFSNLIARSTSAVCVLLNETHNDSSRFSCDASGVPSIYAHQHCYSRL